MTVLEYAKQLGEAIANDEVMKNFNEAKKKYEENESLQKLLVEYNTHRVALGEQFKMDLSEQDESLIKSIRARIDEIFSIIVSTISPYFLNTTVASSGVGSIVKVTNSGSITFNKTSTV